MNKLFFFIILFLFKGSLPVEEVHYSVDGVVVNLFPVPATDYLNIQVNNVANDGLATIHIIDLMGNIVSSKEVNLSQGLTMVTQDLSGLMTGTYLTRIQFENGSSIVKKIVLQSK